MCGKLYNDLVTRHGYLFWQWEVPISCHWGSHYLTPELRRTQIKDENKHNIFFYINFYFKRVKLISFLKAFSERLSLF